MIKNVFFIFFVCVAVFLFYLPSYLQMQDLNEKNRTYEKRISDLEHENVRFAEERRRLENDPEYFEKVAREKMGLIKEDEVIFKMCPVGTVTKTDVNAVAETVKPDAVKKPLAKPRAALKKKASSKKKTTVTSGTRKTSGATKSP